MVREPKASDILRPVGKGKEPRRMPKDNMSKAKVIIAAAITDFVKDLGLFDESYSIEEKVREFVKGIAVFIDLKKLITYGRILVEFNDDGFAVTGLEESLSTSIIEVQHLPENDHISAKVALCKALNLVRYYTGMDNSKHEKYRVSIGLDPNDDEAYNEMLNKTDLTESQISKITEAGYDIIKSVE